MKSGKCCERTCTLDPKDSFKLLKRRILKCDRFEFKKGSLRILPGRTEINRLNNIDPLGYFQRHTDTTTTKRCAVGEILMLLKKRNKVVVVHNNGEPGLGKNKTSLAVCDHLLRNYLEPFKPPWENGIWQIKQSDIKKYLRNDDEKSTEVALNGGFVGWLYQHLSKENTAIKELQNKGNILFVLFAPIDQKLLRRLFLKLVKVQKSLPEYTQFIVTCRKPPNIKDFYFQKVAVEPLSFSDGSRLFEQFLRNMKKWGKWIAPQVLQFHNGHGRERKTHKSSYCKGCIKRRRFSCRNNNHETCESCWASWELKYFFAKRERPFFAQWDVPWGDSNLPDFGEGIKLKCAKSKKNYLEIMDIVLDMNNRPGSPPPTHAF